MSKIRSFWRFYMPKETLSVTIRSIHTYVMSWDLAGKMKAMSVVLVHCWHFVLDVETRLWHWCGWA